MVGGWHRVKERHRHRPKAKTVILRIANLLSVSEFKVFSVYPA
jgi:hypothetical protein